VDNFEDEFSIIGLYLTYQTNTMSNWKLTPLLASKY